MEKAAKMVAYYEEMSGNGEKSIASLREVVKTIQAGFENFKGLDPEKILQEVEALKEKNKSLETAFKTSKRGDFYFPGMEDEVENFSLTKYINAKITGNWKDAQHEKELVAKAMETFRSKGAAQSVGDDSSGGEFVPDQFLADVILPAYRKSTFISLDGEGETRVSVMDRLNAGNVKIPKFAGGVVAYWIGEEDDYTQSLAKTGLLTASMKKLGVLLKITESMLRSGSFGFERLLRRDMAKAIAAKLDWTFIYGKGTEDMPRGLVAQPNVKYLSASKYATGTGYLAQNLAEAKAANFFDGGAIDINFLGETKLALQEADLNLTGDFMHILPPRALFKMRQRFNSAGDPVVLNDTDLAALIGNFAESTLIATGQNAGHGLFTPASSTNDGKCSMGVHGELSELVLMRFGGVEILTDGGTGTGFVNDTTLIKARMWADIVNRSEESFVLTPDIKIL